MYKTLTFLAGMLASATAFAATPVPTYTEARAGCIDFLAESYIDAGKMPPVPDATLLDMCTNEEASIRKMLTVQWEFFSERAKQICVPTSTTYRSLSACISDVTRVIYPPRRSPYVGGSTQHFYLPRQNM